jgi:hypothetical protein
MRKIKVGDRLQGEYYGCRLVYKSRANTFTCQSLENILLDCFSSYVTNGFLTHAICVGVRACLSEATHLGRTAF